MIRLEITFFCFIFKQYTHLAKHRRESSACKLWFLPLWVLLLLELARWARRRSTLIQKRSISFLNFSFDHVKRQKKRFFWLFEANFCDLVTAKVQLRMITDLCWGRQLYVIYFGGGEAPTLIFFLCLVDGEFENVWWYGFQNFWSYQTGEKQQAVNDRVFLLYLFHFNCDSSQMERNDKWEGAHTIKSLCLYIIHRPYSQDVHKRNGYERKLSWQMPCLQERESLLFFFGVFSYCLVLSILLLRISRMIMKMIIGFMDISNLLRRCKFITHGCWFKFVVEFK